MTALRIEPAGDASLLVSFGDTMDVAVNALVVAAARALEGASLAGVRDVVPAIAAVGVHFDPAHTNVERLGLSIRSLVSSLKPSAAKDASTIDVPVCYGGTGGPDLGEVAAFAGMDEAGVVGAHTAGTYRVYMLGFCPGFAYLGTVDARIATPRRRDPRRQVPAGSVGIAGAQTGIYPFAMPGGWQIVGRTPLRPCDFGRSDPFLFAPGDRVRFHAIDADRFERLTREASRA